MDEEEVAAIVRRARKQCIDEFAMCRNPALMKDDSHLGIDVQIEYAKIIAGYIEKTTPEPKDGKACQTS